MTEQTNAELIAEAKTYVTDEYITPDTRPEESLIRRLADALEAAERRADQAEAELRDVWRTDIPSLKDQRDQLAAVVEKVRASCQDPDGLADVPDEDLTDVQYGERTTSASVLDILATAPADALRVVKAEVWEEAIAHVEPVLGAKIKRAAHADNPYREAQP